jgi:hypothetical protein
LGFRSVAGVTIDRLKKSATAKAQMLISHWLGSIVF